MTLLLVLVWAVTVGLAVRAVVGPRSWHRRIVAPTQPGLGDPTDAGYSWLALRNGVLALAAVAVAVVLTLRALPPSSEELAETADVAVDLVDLGELDDERLDAELTVLLGRPVRVVVVTRAVTAGQPPEEVEGQSFFEVRVTDDDATLVGDLAGAVACVEIQQDTTSDGVVYQQYGSTGTGRCEG